MNTVDRFNKLSLSSIAQANGNKGVMNYDIARVWASTKVCAQAVTMDVLPEVNKLSEAILEKVDGKVLVIATDHYDSSNMDEVFQCRLKKAGVIAIVTDGTVRNVKNLEKIGLPVFAKGVCDRLMSGKVKANLCRNIVCSGVPVKTGDWIFANEDGVVVVNDKNLDKVLSKAELIENQKKAALATL